MGGWPARIIRGRQAGGGILLFRRGTSGKIPITPRTLVGHISEQRPDGLPDEAGSGPVTTEHLEFVVGEPVSPFPGIGVRRDGNSVQSVVEEADRQSSALATSQSWPAPIALAPRSYFCICWNDSPSALPSSDWDRPSSVRRRRIRSPMCSLASRDAPVFLAWRRRSTLAWLS